MVVAVWGERPILWAARLGARFLPVSRERLEQIGRNAAVGLAGLHRPRLAAVAFGWTMLSWLALAASCAALLEGFDTGLSTEDVLLAGLLVVIATNFAMILPSSPAALGVFEAATVVALGAFGIDDSEALSYALVLHALNLIPYLVIGGVLLRSSARGQNRRSRSRGSLACRGSVGVASLRCAGRCLPHPVPLRRILAGLQNCVTTCLAW